eukprot:scaffold144738_cov15-Tisochrysis_lutea.AAC.1
MSLLQQQQQHLLRSQPFLFTRKQQWSTFLAGALRLQFSGYPCGCKSSHEVTLDEASVSAPIAGVLAARALH